MKHSELRQFLKEANASNLSPTEKDVFQYYFSKTQNSSGFWHCPDAETADELFRSRSGVSEARNSLIERGWITENGKYNIRILKTFSSEMREKASVEFPTKLVENSTNKPEGCRVSDNLVEFPTESVEFPTKTPEILSSFRQAYKEEDKFKEFKRKEEKEIRENVEFKHEANHAPEIRTPEKIDFDNIYLQIFAEFYPNQLLTVPQIVAITNRIRDGDIWRRVLEFWTQNAYRAESIGKMCKLYDDYAVEGIIRNGTDQQSNSRSYAKSQPKATNADIYDSYGYFDHARS